MKIRKNLDDFFNKLKQSVANQLINVIYSEIRIYCENANNALMNIKAKQYIDDKIGPEFVQVVFGK